MKKVGFVALVFVLFVSIGIASAEEITRFDAQFALERGTPVIYETDVFYSEAGTAVLRVYNGLNNDPDTNIRSAIVIVNGEVVMRPKELRQGIDNVEKEIVLDESNAIVVIAWGRPNGNIGIEIVQEVDVSNETGSVVVTW